ncbi:MAG: hypothetical protein AAFV53_32700 [Myxococcota bacterium]
MHRRLAAMVVVTAIGCGAPDGREDTGQRDAPIALMDPEALAPIEAAVDPLARHRPPSVDCPDAAWGEEGGGFEVQTGVCNYAAFAHPLDTPLFAGDEIEILIWHDLLDAVEPGIGHVAVSLGEDVIWEAEVAIPASSAALQATVSLDTAPPVGAPLGLHLHNHGFNSWRFVSVEVLP